MVMRTPYARTRGSQQPQSQHGAFVVVVVVFDGVVGLDIVDLMELPVVVERSLVMFLGKGTIHYTGSQTETKKSCSSVDDTIDYRVFVVVDLLQCQHLVCSMYHSVRCSDGVKFMISSFGSKGTTPAEEELIFLVHHPSSGSKHGRNEISEGSHYKYRFLYIYYPYYCTVRLICPSTGVLYKVFVVC